MKKNTGLKPYFVKSKKDYSFHRTFGSINPVDLPLEYNVDPGFTNEDQGATTVCTAETVTDMCTDEDGIIYSVGWQYAKTLQLMNVPTSTEGADLKTAMSVPVIFGSLPEKDAPMSLKNNSQIILADHRNWGIYCDNIASKNKKTAYFMLEDGQYDWFDDIRSTMWSTRDEKRSVALGIPWYQEYNDTGSDGIVKQGIRQISWHACAVKGWVIRKGIMYLKIKSWRGRNAGDNGFLYFSREEINRLLSVYGSCGGTITKKVPIDIKTVKISLFQQIIGLYQQIASKLFPPKYNGKTNI